MRMTKTIISSVHSSSTQGSPNLAQQFQEASASQQNTSRKRPLFTTLEDDPAKHNLQHEGMFYTVPPEEAGKYLAHAQPRFRNMCKAFNETAIMVRKPAVEVIHYLKAANYDTPPVRYVLYGDHGAGKSTSLSHIMQYCGRQNWIVAHIPWVASYNRFFGEVQASSFKPGRIDIPKEAAKWLIYFKSVNLAGLKELKLLHHYTWNRRESAEVDSPLLAAIEFGITRPKYATDVVGLIVKEMKAHATASNIRLLFVVDGVNSLWQPTTIRCEDVRHKNYHASELTLVHNFKKLLANDWKNGAILCTVDRMGQVDLGHNSSNLPRYLLGQEGFECLDAFVPINVPVYNNKEIASALDYLIEHRWIQNDRAWSAEGKRELIFLTQKNPYQLLEISGVW